MSRVGYIPAQTTEEALTTADRASLQSPSRLFFRDAGVLFKNLKYVPYITKPTRQATSIPGVPESDTNKAADRKESFLNVVTTIIELILFLLAPTLVMALPGSVLALLSVFVVGIISLLQGSMWGSLIVTSQDPSTYWVPRPSERWFFINGIATSHRSLQTTCDRLAATFQRPFTGVHNRSYGIIGDVLECLVQRTLGYNTMDVRQTFEVLRKELLDQKAEKVVVIAHSQGGIVISLVLDKIFAELPSRSVNKLEIYTFGSAASHFNNPHNPSSVLPSRSNHLASLFVHNVSHTKTINYIEHYVNALDLVPRWGVLYNASNPLNRYAGRVFINKTGSGHLFNEHYLDIMFPWDLNNPQSQGVSGTTEKVNKFLDQVVEVGERGASRDKFAWSRKEERKDGIKRAQERIATQHEYFVPAADAAERPVHTRTTTAAVERGGGDSDAHTGSEARGKTVRQLSRLWKYVGGHDADRESIS